MSDQNNREGKTINPDQGFMDSLKDYPKPKKLYCIVEEYTEIREYRVEGTDEFDVRLKMTPMTPRIVRSIQVRVQEVTDITPQIVQ